jgi:hypothetical protein
MMVEERITIASSGEAGEPLGPVLVNGNMGAARDQQIPYGFAFRNDKG